MQPIWFGKFKAILFVEPWFSEFLSCLLCYASPYAFNSEFSSLPFCFYYTAPVQHPCPFSHCEVSMSFTGLSDSKPFHLQPTLFLVGFMFTCVCFFVCFFFEHLRISDCHLSFTFLTPDLCYAKELKLLFKEWFKDYATMAVPWAPTLYPRKPSIAPVPSFGEDGFLLIKRDYGGRDLPYCLSCPFSGSQDSSRIYRCEENHLVLCRWNSIKINIKSWLCGKESHKFCQRGV